DSFVSFNGQYVVFENEAIYRNPLNQSELNKFLHVTNANDHPLIFMNESTMKATTEYHSYIETSLGSLLFPHPEEDASFYIDKEIYQSLLFCSQDEEKQYFEKFPEFDFIRWHPYSVDVLPKGGSKAEGIKQMIDRLGFDLKDVYAFGDGMNDLEMLKAVGTGVAMGNAVSEAKALADLVTSDVSQNGIWNGLKELQLI
ncbi:Cof-type HAD-IIB family hydrolase, partial [Neobacillus vireti]